MRAAKVVHVVSRHAEGEVGDVIVGGIAPPPGDSLWEQSGFIAKDFVLRNFLLNEPAAEFFGTSTSWCRRRLAELGMRITATANEQIGFTMRAFRRTTAPSTVKRSSASAVGEGVADLERPAGRRAGPPEQSHVVAS